MAKTTAVATTAATSLQTAIANRPSYLPAVADDAAIFQINQRGAALPILSINNNEFRLLEGQTLIHTFSDEKGNSLDECTMWFLHIHYDQQRRAYEEEWDEDNPADPVCQSDDGITPLEAYADPESPKCGTCWRNQENTKRSDKCSWLRNAIVLVNYETDDGKTVSVIARLRLNGNTLFGEENRSSGELNAESMVRRFKEMNGQLWYHPVVAFFDTTSKNARNKLLFEILLNEYPTEDQAEFIMAQEQANDYPELTRLKVQVESDEDGGDTESSAAPQREAAKPRATKKAGSKSAEAAPTRSKRGAKKDPPSDDSAGADPAPRSRRARKGAADTGGEPTVETTAESTDDDSGSGDGAVESGDSGDANPLADAGIADLIGKVQLP